MPDESIPIWFEMVFVFNMDPETEIIQTGTQMDG